MGRKRREEVGSRLPDPPGGDDEAPGHRLPALDAALGVLALLVALHHLAQSQHDLSHVLVMVEMFRLCGAWAAFPALPLELAAAWAIWWAVERPSILLSRRACAILGRLLHPGDHVRHTTCQEKERAPS